MSKPLFRVKFWITTAPRLRDWRKRPDESTIAYDASVFTPYRSDCRHIFQIFYNWASVCLDFPDLSTRETEATQLWDKYVADPALGYSLTGAPLIVKDKVIIGIAGGEYGIRGFIEAFNVYRGKMEWRFYTTAGPEDPAGNKTWPGDTWKHGGATAWQSGNYDPEANLLYWGTGNPGPDYNGDVRLGDNLYSCSMLALDPHTGKLKWYYQANPNNQTDWDAAEVPILVDMDWQGKPRKVMLWADRNGFFYVIDRITGQVLLEKAFIDKQTWNAGFEPNGRPIMAPGSRVTKEGTLTTPDNQGATNWYNPSYSPRTGLFYLNARENYSTGLLGVRSGFANSPDGNHLRDVTTL
jgi:alcohol dehydrogenase (cytochrome c)